MQPGVQLGDSPGGFWSGVLAGERGGWRVLLRSSELDTHGGLDARDSDGTTLLHAAAANGDTTPL